MKRWIKRSTYYKSQWVNTIDNVQHRPFFAFVQVITLEEKFFVETVRFTSFAEVCNVGHGDERRCNLLCKPDCFFAVSLQQFVDEPEKNGLKIIYLPVENFLKREHIYIGRILWHYELLRLWVHMFNCNNTYTCRCDRAYMCMWKCPWCNGYRRWKWIRRYEFKSSTRLLAFHIALISLGKVWIQLFSYQLWVNNRPDWFFLALVRQPV